MTWKTRKQGTSRQRGKRFPVRKDPKLSAIEYPKIAQLHGSFHFVRKIPTSTIKRIWNEITSNEMPSVQAFIVTNAEFYRQVDKFRKTKMLRDTSMQEWGEVFPHERLAALSVFDDNKNQFLIMIRKDRPKEYPVSMCLEHELRHILRGDVS